MFYQLLYDLFFGTGHNNDNDDSYNNYNGNIGQ
jgi:hypothetical protein